MQKEKRKEAPQRFKYWPLVSVTIILLLTILPFVVLLDLNPSSSFSLHQLRSNIPMGGISYTELLSDYAYDYRNLEALIVLLPLALAQLIAIATMLFLRRKRIAFGLYLLSTLVTGAFALGMSILIGYDDALVIRHLDTIQANGYSYHLAEHTVLIGDPGIIDYSVYLYRCQHDRDDCTVIETPYQDQWEPSTHGVPFADLMLWHDQTPGYLNIVGGGVVLYSWKLDDLNAEMDALGR